MSKKKCQQKYNEDCFKGRKGLLAIFSTPVLYLKL